MELLRNILDWAMAVIEHWHGYVTGSTLAFGLELIKKFRDWEPSKKVFAAVVVFGLVCSMFSAWQDEHNKVQQYLANENAPDILLRYLPVQNSPSGFEVSNCGKDTARRIQINDIRVGNRIAKFGKLIILRPDCTESATYSEADNLDSVFMALPADAGGHGRITVTINYWASDQMREFKTTCTFLYYVGQHRADLEDACSRDLIPKE
jgi:hypothetical protein